MLFSKKSRVFYLFLAETTKKNTPKYGIIYPKGPEER